MCVVTASDFLRWGIQFSCLFCCYVRMWRYPFVEQNRRVFGFVSKQPKLNTSQSKRSVVQPLFGRWFAFCCYACCVSVGATNVEHGTTSRDTFCDVAKPPCGENFSSPLLMGTPCKVQRFGEAKHPGPQPLMITIANVTSLHERTCDLIHLWGSGIHCLAETSATASTVKNEQFHATRQKFALHHGKPVPPIALTKKGVGSRRGQCKGVAVLTDQFFRPVQHVKTFTAWEAHRLMAGYIRIGKQDVLLIVAYCFQKNHDNAIPMNRELHSQIFQLLGTWTGPAIVAADFNCDISQTPTFKDGYVKLGFEDTRNLHFQQTKTVLPPTCVGSSVTETILISQSLARHFLRAEVSTNDIFPTHSPVHLFFDLDLPEVPRHHWDLPKPLPCKYLTSAQLAYCADIKQEELARSFDNAIHRRDPDAVFRVWSSNAESIFQEAVAFQHSVNPEDFPLPTIGTKYLGRGTCPKRVTSSSKVKVVNPRQGEFMPCFDPVTNVARQKAKQVRRIDSLLNKIAFQTAQGKDINNHGNLAEWSAITKAKGYGKRFCDWILHHSDCDFFPIQNVDHEYITYIQKIVRADCEHYCKRDYDRRNHNFTDSLLQDWKQKGGKKTFDIMANRSFHTFNAMLITSLVPVTRLRWIRKGVLQVKLHTPSQVLPTDEVRYAQTQLRCLACTENCVELQWPSNLDAPLRFFHLEVARWTRDPEEMANGWFNYWSDFWEKDPVDDHSDNWDAAIRTILLTPVQEVVPLDVTKEDLQVAIKDTPKNSARGLCGWNIREISILPDQFVNQLVDFFHLCIDTDWPDVFSQVRVSLPPKNDNPHKPKDGRPICIFSQVYRIIAKALARKIASRFSFWMPSGIVGGLPKRDASDIFYTIQLKVEKALETGRAIQGFCLDIQKCYNALSRIPLLFALRHLGVDPQIVSLWEKLLGRLRRTVCLADSFSELKLSTCGIAEGDPLAVPAMTAVCFIWQCFVDPATAFSYADNWELLTDQMRDLHFGVARTCDFLDAWRLKPDITKSWAWSSHHISVEDKDTLVGLVSRFGELSFVNHNSDLGANIRYKRVMALGPIRDRFDQAINRASRLHSVTLPPELLCRALVTGSLSLVRHASEICPIGLRWYESLRSAFADVLCSNQNNDIIDPELKIIKQCFKTARVFLFKFPEWQPFFVKLLASHPGGPFNSHGPIGCLKRWILRLGWWVTEDGTIVTNNRITISILSSCLHEIFSWIDTAWSQIVISQVDHRKGLGNLPDINLGATTRCLTKQETSNRRIMTKYLAGAWTTGDKIAHWKPNDNRCILCQNPDSIHHRFFECPFTGPIRDEHRSTITLVEELAPFWPYSPLIPRHPDETKWWQQCSLEVGIPFHNLVRDPTSNKALSVYTDGSCWFGSVPEAGIAAWTVIVDLAETDEQRVEAAVSWHKGAPWPVTLKPLHSGGIVGRQSNDRAELYAIIVAISLIQKIRVFSDSQYALGLLDIILNRQFCIPDISVKPNWDLVCKLIVAVGDRTSDDIQSFHIHSHQNLDDDIPPIEKYHRLGNAVADYNASRYLETNNPDLIKIPQDIFDHVNFFSALWKDFTLVACKITRLFGKNSASAKQDLQPSEDQRMEQRLEHWQPSAPLRTFSCNLTADLVNSVPHPQVFSLALACWINHLQWPCRAEPCDPGVSWLELFVDFRLATGVLTPIAEGSFKGNFKFRMPNSADQLVEQPLSVHLKHFRSGIKAIANVCQTPTHPDCFVSRCKSLLYFSGGRETTGFGIRPSFVSSRTVTCIQALHEQGGSKRGKKGFDVSKIPVGPPCLVLPEIVFDETTPEQRIGNFVRLKERRRYLARQV